MPWLARARSFERPTIAIVLARERRSQIASGEGFKGGAAADDSSMAEFLDESSAKGRDWESAEPRKVPRWLSFAQRRSVRKTTLNSPVEELLKWWMLKWSSPD